MRNLFSALLVVMCAGCSTPQDVPSLAPRAAEAIDPRVPIASDPSPGSVDPAISAALAEQLAAARGAVGAFDSLARRAETLAAVAGSRQSESWIAAQQALSALGAQHGITTSAAANIDAIASARIARTRWINPATREAIEAAAREVGVINERQTAILSRLGGRLGS